MSFIPAFAIIELTSRQAFVFVVVAVLVVALISAILIGGVMCVDHILGGHVKQ